MSAGGWFECLTAAKTAGTSLATFTTAVTAIPAGARHTIAADDWDEGDIIRVKADRSGLERGHGAAHVHVPVHAGDGRNADHRVDVGCGAVFDDGAHDGAVGSRRYVDDPVDRVRYVRDVDGDRRPHVAGVRRSVVRPLTLRRVTRR